MVWIATDSVKRLDGTKRKVPHLRMGNTGKFIVTLIRCPVNKWDQLEGAR